jgi:lipopolysaccharide transport system permease protein
VAAGQTMLTVIEPGGGLGLASLREVWQYRELLWVLTRRDIRVRYQQTVLGMAWAVLQPVGTMLLFTLVFGRLARIPTGGSPYPLFVYAALLPWLFFSNGVAAAGASLLGSAHLVSKVYFPRILIPVSSTGAHAVDLAVSAVALLLLALYYRVDWTLQVLVLPVVLLGVLVLTLGVGIGLSALTVTYRDFRFVVPFLLQIWLFLTPVVYPAAIVPEGWRPALFLNPMAGFVEAARAALTGREIPLAALGLAWLAALATFAAGASFFLRVERRFADVI